MESVNRMLHTTLLAAHIFAGSAGLVLGPVAMYLDTRRFSAGQRGTGRASGVHRGAVLLVCLSAVGLVIDNRPERWWLIPVSALTYGLAVLARESATRRRFRGWSHGYAHGQGGHCVDRGGADRRRPGHRRGAAGALARAHRARHRPHRDMASPPGRSAGRPVFDPRDTVSTPTGRERCHVVRLPGHSHR